jgi:hypothetical protein
MFVCGGTNQSINFESLKNCRILSQSILFFVRFYWCMFLIIKNRNADPIEAENFFEILFVMTSRFAARSL